MSEGNILQNTREGPQQDQPALSQWLATQQVSKVVASSGERPCMNWVGKEATLESARKAAGPELYTLGHSLVPSCRHPRDGP